MAFLIPENLRSRRDVPPAVQTMARLLADHLDFGATVWYEPLFSVDDDRPDLVVLVPDAGVLVLEVLQAKRTAVVAVSGTTLTVKDEDGPVEVAHPLARARLFADQIRERARQAGVAVDDELPVLAAGVFGYIDRRTADERGLADAVDVGVCLFRDDIDDMNESPDAARRRVAQLLATPLRDGVISEEGERLYRAVIHPDTVLTPVQGELPGFTAALTVDVKALDREQEALAKTLGAGHRVIRGVAGSGKTVVLIHRARLLAQLNRHDRILVTCYNRSLRGYLERQLKPFTNVTVATLHQQMCDVIRMAGEEPPGQDSDEEMSETAQRAMAALDTLQDVGANFEIKLFDHVLVDEAQDFTVEVLQFAVRLLRRGSDSLLVVADAAQTLSSRKSFRWKDAGIVATGRRTRVLRRNYRNTRQILDFAWSFLSKELSLGIELDGESESTDVVVPPEAGVRDGALPVVQQAPSRDAEVLAIAAQVREWLADVPAGDIAVLYGSRFAGGGGFNWIDKIGFALDEVGVPWYWPTDPATQAAKATVGALRDKVLVSTIRSAKGLEFPRVILCAYLDKHPPEKMDESRRMIYVGMTRAIDRLVLTASGTHRFIADLEEGPSG